MRHKLFLLPLVVAALSLPLAAQQPPRFETPHSFQLVEATIPEMQAALEMHVINSKQLVKLYLDRIEAYGGLINPLITVNPNAIAEAQRLDIERAHGHVRGPLHGIPIVLKDNIHTTNMPTTGGAWAFKGYGPPYEASLVTKLRAAGAIILGKTVLSELANWVSNTMPGNYSAVGGMAFNPYDPRPDPRTVPPYNDGRPVLSPGGSSSAAATAANLAAANVGTDTSGSILSPANQTNLVGIRPTTGLVSRYGVIPIVADQDTAGPMARDVASAAILLGAMAGFDRHDPATAACPCQHLRWPGPSLWPFSRDFLEEAPYRMPWKIPDYTAHLDPGGLSRARIALALEDYNALTGTIPNDARRALVDQAVFALRGAGATVDMVSIPSYADLQAFPACAGPTQGKGNDANCSIVLKYGFKRDFNAWLDSLGSSAPVHTLTELIAFNNVHAAEAIKYGQPRFLISEEMDLAGDGARYQTDRARDLQLSRTNGLDPVLNGPDGVPGTADDYDAVLFGGNRGWEITSRAGYPTIVLPMGFVPNIPSSTAPPFPPDFVAKPSPYGIAFTGRACSEPTLIRIAYAFEQITRGRVPPESTPPLPKDSKGHNPGLK